MDDDWLPVTKRISEAAWKQVQRILKLSEKQLLVLRLLLVDRLTPEAIALKLEREITTVKTHIERIHAKLGTHCMVDVTIRVWTVFWGLEQAGRGR